MLKTSLLVWVMLLSGYAALAAQTNLVKNPGFEEPAKPGGVPAGGWWLYQGQGETEARTDRSIAHSGSASVKIHASAKAKSVLVSAPFAVAAGDEIRFEGWVRGEQPQPQAGRTYVGLAFRRADNAVFEHANLPAEALSGAWTRVSGFARAPEAAVSAEVHLGYSNAPGTLWFDDISATITNPVSISLTSGAKPWTGPQELSVLLVNRAPHPFQGSISAKIGQQAQSLTVAVDAETNRLVTVPITLKGVGVHNYAISLLDSTGLPVRALKGKFHTQPPLVLSPACPCYHAAGEGDGNTRIDARVNMSPGQRSGLRFIVEVSDAARNKIQTAEADTSGAETVGVDVRVPVEKPASFSVTARLVDHSGKQIAQATTEVKVGATEDARVTVGPDGFLRVGGQPSFPIGLYSSGREQEMGKAGFTATHNYGITTGEPDEPINRNDSHLRELLDRSQRNGMRMMVELPRRAIETAQWAQVRRRIETFRHHPGLLCWGSEERVARGVAPLTNIAALYRLVHELDPDHPLVLGDTKDVITKFQVDRRDFFPDDCMDIGIWWWYPIPLKGPDGNGLDGRGKVTGNLEPPSWLTTTLSKRPLWIAIQAYQQPRKDAPFPTPAEYRCLAYLSIIKGVKGLWFYTGSGQRDYLGKPAGLLNKPEEGHWDYVQKLVRELRTVSPIIMAPASTAKLSVSPANAPIEYTLRQAEGRLYLLAANKSPQPQAVRFSGSALAGKRVQVLQEAHPAVVQGDSLSDEFSALDVHVYMLE
jgi:hypothetical protein